MTLTEHNRYLVGNIHKRPINYIKDYDRALPRKITKKLQLQ